jgi:poly-gamma-glutamate capsule biosynthesis protein CapA/YwtB (metallophosphatase superfamily)
MRRLRTGRALARRAESLLFPRAALRRRGLAADAGIGLVSLANNHILDYDVQGLLDTLRILDAHGIAHAGAGVDLAAALAPVIVERRGVRIGMAAFCDHQDDFAAAADHPGMAWLGLHDEAAAIDAFARALAPLRAQGVRWPVLSLHWGPNMVSEPSAQQRRLATCGHRRRLEDRVRAQRACVPGRGAV